MKISVFVFSCLADGFIQSDLQPIRGLKSRWGWGGSHSEPDDMRVYPEPSPARPGLVSETPLPTPLLLNVLRPGT